MLISRPANAKAEPLQAFIPRREPGNEAVTHGCRQWRLAMLIPLTMAPTMPTNPWSVPHKNTFGK